MNREKAHRQAVLDVLLNLTVNIDLGSGVQSVVIPVYDNKLESDENIYVLLEAQTAQNESAFPVLIWRGIIEVSIYHTQQDSATFDIIDAIGEEVENKIINAPGISNFAPQTGWQISNTYLNSVNSLKYQEYKDGGGTVVQKIMQFSSQLIKK